MCIIDYKTICFIATLNVCYVLFLHIQTHMGQNRSFCVGVCADFLLPLVYQKYPVTSRLFLIPFSLVKRMSYFSLSEMLTLFTQ